MEPISSSDGNRNFSICVRACVCMCVCVRARVCMSVCCCVRLCLYLHCTRSHLLISFLQHLQGEVHGKEEKLYKVML